MQADDYAGAERLAAAAKERLAKALPAPATTEDVQSPRRRK
jgi:hypothetical protein